MRFVIDDLICTIHGHTRSCIDKTNICFSCITIMHLNIETLLNAFRFPLSGPANRKSDSIMLQNVCICHLMQFKTSTVKYNGRNYIFKPFWAPGCAGRPCRRSHAAVLHSSSRSTGSLSLTRSFHPQPTLKAPTLKASSALFPLSCFLTVKSDVHIQGVVCEIPTHFKEL